MFWGVRVLAPNSLDLCLCATKGEGEGVVISYCDFCKTDIEKETLDRDICFDDFTPLLSFYVIVSLSLLIL